MVGGRKNATTEIIAAMTIVHAADELDHLDHQDPEVQPDQPDRQETKDQLDRQEIRLPDPRVRKDRQVHKVILV